jgi:general secretion pathway protein F
VEPAAQLRQRRRSAGARECAVVFRSLASLVGAGVPLDRALEATAAHSRKRLAEALHRITSRVRSGDSLGTALSEEGDLFPLLTVGLIRAGERGVGLTAALSQAAMWAESRAETEGRVRAALVYPMLLGLVGAASVAFIVGVIVPRFAAILADVGQELPPATEALLAAASLVRSPLALLPSVFVAVWVCGWLLSPTNRLRLHRHLIRLPLAGPLRHRLATSRAASSLGILLEAGTPAHAALGVAAEAAGDTAIAARLRASCDLIAEGSSLSRALRSTGSFTPLALQLVAIGEGSGNLPSMLLRASEMEQREAERRLRSILSVLEPALIIVFGAVVAFVAAALLQAVYTLRPL